MQCLVVGDNGVGKTSLCRAFAQMPFRSKHIATDEYEQYQLDVQRGNESHTMRITEITAKCLGKERFYKWADLVIVIYSIIHPSSFEDLYENWVEPLIETSPDVKFIVVGTHADVWGDTELLKQLKRNKIQPVAGHQAANASKRLLGAAAFMECSPKIGTPSMHALFKQILSMAIKRKHSKETSLGISSLRHQPQQLTNGVASIEDELSSPSHAVNDASSRRLTHNLSLVDQENSLEQEISRPLQCLELEHSRHQRALRCINGAQSQSSPQLLRRDFIKKPSCVMLQAAASPVAMLKASITQHHEMAENIGVSPMVLRKLMNIASTRRIIVSKYLSTKITVFGRCESLFLALLSHDSITLDFNQRNETERKRRKEEEKKIAALTLCSILVVFLL